jgi:excinuclease ABC subunit B
MYQHARDLEFEEAAKVRDQIRRLKDASLAG